MYQYLFFLNNEKITVIEYDREREKKFKYLSNKGEKTFFITDEFWEWWSNAVSYVEGQSVDFCFIYDKVYDISNDEFVRRLPKVQESCWTRLAIKNFLTTMLGYDDIILRDSCGHELHVRKSEYRHLDSSQKMFYTNMEYTQEDMSIAEKRIKEGEISPLAEYWRELLLSENE